METTLVESTLIQNGFLVLPDRVIKGDLRLSGKRIQEFNTQLSPMADERILDAGGAYILPGFIDIHNHGAVGFDFTLGAYDQEKDWFNKDDTVYLEGITRALEYFLKQGATRILATTLAAPPTDLIQAFHLLNDYLGTDPAGLAIALAGINLEGTFIKDAAFAGAQNPEYFQSASARLFDRLQDASGGNIRIVNIPPEHGIPGLELTSHLSGQGVIVAGGHSGAYGTETHQAIDKGLRLAVHYFNGPNRQSYKSFSHNGAMEAFLVRDEVSLELIVDGFHVDPAYVLDAIQRKGIDRIIPITDSLFVNGSDTINAFSLAGIPGQVSADKQYLKVAGQMDTLFGSILTPLKGFTNLLDWMTHDRNGIWIKTHSGHSKHEALVMISRMMSGNPARLLGLDKDQSTGAATGMIAQGYSADILVMDLTQSDQGMPSIRHCFLAGKMIY